MSQALSAPAETSLRTPLVTSLVLHLLAVSPFLLMVPRRAPPMPPTYRVNLIAAPPGPRNVGVVTPEQPVPAPAVPTPAPRARTAPEVTRSKTPLKTKATKAPKLATPSVAPAAKSAPAAAPVAGGGPTGGRGADVANVTVDGIAFPYPDYLNNVVRQIARQFNPSRAGAGLRAVVAFVIRRDGSVMDIRLTSRSGVYSFDADAMAAVEVAAKNRAFGPLPTNFPDDVLPVIFSFDPRLIR